MFTYWYFMYKICSALRHFWVIFKSNFAVLGILDYICCQTIDYLVFHSAQREQTVNRCHSKLALLWDGDVIIILGNRTRWWTWQRRRHDNPNICGMQLVTFMCLSHAHACYIQCYSNTYFFISRFGGKLNFIGANINFTKFYDSKKIGCILQWHIELHSTEKCNWNSCNCNIFVLKSYNAVCFM